MKRIPKFQTAYDTLPTVSSEESKGQPELMLVDTGEKRNITFKDNSPFRAYFTGTDTYLPMAPWADTADTYAYSHDGSIYRVPKQGFEPSTDDLNAHQRYEKALNNTTVKDLDKLMLAYLGLGTAPITLPAATSNVLMPMVMNPVSTALGLGGYELGSRGFDNVMQRYTGKNWSEYMKDKYNMPEWASGLINPVGILTGGVGSLAGRMYEQLGKNALKQGATALGREALVETAPATQEIPWSNPDGYYVTPQIRRVNFGADVAAGENGGRTGVVKISPNKRSTEVLKFDDGVEVPEGFIPVKIANLRGRDGMRTVHQMKDIKTGKFKILEDLNIPSPKPIEPQPKKVDLKNYHGERLTGNEEGFDEWALSLIPEEDHFANLSHGLNNESLLPIMRSEFERLPNGSRVDLGEIFSSDSSSNLLQFARRHPDRIKLVLPRNVDDMVVSNNYGTRGAESADIFNEQLEKLLDLHGYSPEAVPRAVYNEGSGTLTVPKLSFIKLFKNGKKLT